MCHRVEFQAANSKHPDTQENCTDRLLSDAVLELMLGVMIFQGRPFFAIGK